jgi:SAM-dependent methyltransferase
MDASPDIKAQSSLLLTHAAGYVAQRTSRSGCAMASSPPWPTGLAPRPTRSPRSSAATPSTLRCGHVRDWRQPCWSGPATATSWRHVPGLADRLAAGAQVLETACGAGVGLVLLAVTYPDTTLVGVDGDAYSLELAAKRIGDAGLTDRIELVHSPLEQFAFESHFDVGINNISMHECRDLDRATANTLQALVPGGWFVISDFPFPDNDDMLRTVPGRIMSGIQFFEAQIDDQLLPVTNYLDLLARHGFDDIDTITLTPMHALTFGRVPENGG